MLSISTYFAAINKLHSCFPEEKVHEITVGECANKVWCCNGR